MGLHNNKSSIVRGFKNRFEKTKSPVWASLVEAITGEQPDWNLQGKDTGIEMPLSDHSKLFNEVSELDFINEPIH